MNNKFKTMQAVIAIILAVLAICFSTVFIGLFIFSGLNIGISQKNNDETFLLSSYSPDEKYELNAYRTEPGATVDHSVKVYLIKNNKRNLIYNAYHESEVTIVWVDNEIVSINGKKLNLSKGEKYDWRKY